MTPGIETEGLGKRFGSVWALHDCSITVPAGAVAGLVGGNGAGKTTLLRALAGLARPSAGRASVAGMAPADAPTFLAGIGYLAQEVPLYRRWTAEDHLAMGAHLNARWDDASARDRLLGLRIPLDRRVESLSGGMRAQLALALALAKRPEALLLDEPLAALDPFARHEFMGSLVGAIADHPVTVLLSSHLLPDLERVCDHLVILSEAHAQLAGAIDEILAGHRLLTGPRCDPAAIARVHQVIRATHTERQTSLLVRADCHVFDACWEVHEVDLEEIVLAYLGYDHARVREAVAG